MANQVGATGLLMKPFQIDVLLHALARSVPVRRTAAGPGIFQPVGLDAAAPNLPHTSAAPRPQAAGASGRPPTSDEISDLLHTARSTRTAPR